jgi:hypothetical protein
MTSISCEIGSISCDIGSILREIANIPREIKLTKHAPESGRRAGPLRSRERGRPAAGSAP